MWDGLEGRTDDTDASTRDINYVVAVLSQGAPFFGGGRAPSCRPADLSTCANSSWEQKQKGNDEGDDDDDER